MSFEESIRNAAEEFVAWCKESSDQVKIIGNLDTDGICGVSILAGALAREGRRCSISFARQATGETLEGLKKEGSKVVFFVDLGANGVREIERACEGKKVYVLDHHRCERVESQSVKHLNPFLEGSDGTKEICAAGIAYYFVNQVNSENKVFAGLALAGAVGDVQDHPEFRGWNVGILNEAVEKGIVQVKKGVKLLGMHTKPLYKALAQSTYPYLPGVTGNEEGAIKFLESQGIKYKEGKELRRFKHLKEEEQQNLMRALQARRAPEIAWDPNLLGSLYFLTYEPEGSGVRDIRELSVAVNCCCKMKVPSLGVAVCLGDKKAKEKVSGLLQEYQKEILDSLEWFYKNRKTKKVAEEKGVVIVNAEDAVRDTRVGTLASVLSRSGFYPEGTILICLGRGLGGETKVSARVCGFDDGLLELPGMLREVCHKLGGSGGGFSMAAGGMIPQEKEEEFVKTVKEEFSRKATEKLINAPVGGGAYG